MADDGPPPIEGMLQAQCSVAAGDAPPPLTAASSAAAEKEGAFAPLAVSDADGNEQTVMDEMLALAEKARAKKAKAAAAARRDEAKSFGAGMGKGFFNKAKPTKKQAAAAPPPAPAPPPPSKVEEIIELGADGFDLEDATRGDLAGCLREKEAGNAAFKAGKARAALAHYDAALALRPAVEEAAAEEARGLGATLHGNRAACFLKIESWEDAAEAASAALSHDAAHAKSLFRRAQARRQLGQLDAAQVDITAVLAMEPGSKPAKKEQAALQKARRGGGGVFNDIETLRPKSSTAGELGQSSKGFVMPEVQAAMKNANPDLDALKKGEWANEDLVRKMASNPRLVTGMQNPHYKAVLDEMQRDPKGAMEKCKSDPGLAEFIREYMGMMGAHFESLGEKQKEQARRAQQQQQQQQASTAVTDPEAAKEAALKALADKDPEVSKVLADQDIRKMLQDPTLQARLQACNDPRVLRENMADPVFRAQVKKLKDAGLVQIQM